jgi:hypothetical protein
VNERARTRAWIAAALAAGAACAAVLPEMAGARAGEASARQDQPEQPAVPDPATAAQPEAPRGEGSPEDKTRGAENNALVDEMTPEMEAAVSRGLRWLASKQNNDGSFGDQRQWGPSVAITSISGLAFMSDGHLPDRGAYGDVVTRSLEYVLRNCADSGLISSDSGPAPMYGHGFAALFLGEVYGMSAGGGETPQSQRLHEALVRASRLISGCQNEEGGWRYYPVPNDADTSVTICQIMALRSARNAGLEVPKEVIDRAVAYVKRLQNDDGGFRYQAQQPPSAWERSAAGVASLQYAGVYDDQAVRDGLRYLSRYGSPLRMSGNAGARHFYYGHYYAVQAMYLAGGEWWATWWPLIREDLLSKQKADGSWDDSQVGPQYGTAMALIILQMPKRYLPIFQR